MSSEKYASLPQAGMAFRDYCSVKALLKNIFTHCKSGDKDANLIICNKIADIMGELRQLDAPLPLELCYEHLAAAEQAVKDASFRYVLVYKDGKPVMFAYFHLYNISSANFNLEKNTSFVKNIVHLFLDLKKAKVLVLGDALRSGMTGYCYDKQILSSPDVLDALIGVADQLSAADNVSATILPGVQGKTEVERNRFNKLGYIMPWEDTIMEMPVRNSWKSLPDYVLDLTRKYKARANKVLSGMDGITYRALSAADIDIYQHEMSKLFLQVLDKQPFVLSKSGAAYVKALKELYNDKFEIGAYFKGSHLVAFYSAFVNDDSYEVYYVGFDATLNKEYPLYFNMLLTGLQRAIELQKQLLNLGRTSFDAKASLGAVPRHLDYVIKLRQVPDVAVKWFSRYFSAAEDNKWKLRNPLKTEE